MLNRLLSVSLICLSVVTVHAQVTGRVTGSIVDPSGAAVANAKVVLQLGDSGAEVYNTISSSAGDFTISGINPATYKLAIESPGFLKLVVEKVEVNTGRATDLSQMKLELASVGQTVEVVANATGVQTSTAEVSTTVTHQQIENLPVLNRSPLAFLLTQSGVNVTARGNTTINGQRASFSNVTMDGINIQDNFIRTNDLDFLPNLLLTDQVGEVTVITSNTNATGSGGSGQVAFVTPSGTNQYHGSVYWSNRNSALAANTWFNNQSGTKNPFLNQNQLGATANGPVIHNKLFFYSNYEAFRLVQQTSRTNTILTDDARNGIYTYRDTGGVVRKVNILQAAGVPADSSMAAIVAKVPAASNINSFNVGDSSAALLRNTGGYTFLQRNNRTRDNVTFRTDYSPSTKHSFSVTNIWNRDDLDRPDQDTTFNLIPTVQNHENTKLLSSAWRWSPRANLTNEARFGFNWAPAIFLASGDVPKFFITGESFTNPVNTFRTQGRNTDTYNFADNASWVRGSHSLQFGAQAQRVRVEIYNDAGITPSYGLGIGTGNTGLSTTQLPGASASDVSAANTLLSTLAGYYTSYTQTFNVKDRSSGYVNGQTNLRHESVDNYGLYVQDTWKMMRRLTVNAGVRWDYYTPVDERDGLALFPVIQNGNPVQTLLSNATLDFSGGSSGRSWYKADKNNFAPNIGLAWDVFGDGKTAVRAGYSISYVNDNVITAANNSQSTNAGLSSTATASGLAGRVGTGLTAVATPTYKVPRTFADNYALSSTNAEGIINPNLVTPYVQQWSVGVQHSFKSTVVEVRYVGNHGTKEIRAFDYNQVLIGAILPDFQRAQNNGFLAQRAGGAFDPRYNAAIAGSQQLPFFAGLPSGGLLTNSTIVNLIQTGQVGELGSTYQTNALNGSTNFFQNPNGLGMNYVTNFSNSTYNGLQMEVSRRFARGFQFQANYTFSKVLSDAAGNQQTDFEPFLDINNTKLERSRSSDFDDNHVFKANYSYDLPLGKGHFIHSDNALISRGLEGWNIAGIIDIQTGSPFSITSGSRGTLNRGGRSANNEANTSLTKDQLDQIVQFRMTGNGPYFIAASAIGPDGRGVAADGAAPFSGQVFTNAVAGSVGSLQRNFFTGPTIWSYDMKVSKVTRIRERHSLELRADAINIFNHPTFFIGDQSINSTTFGKITSSGTALSLSRRTLQFTAQYRF